MNHTVEVISAVLRRPISSTTLTLGENGTQVLLGFGSVGSVPQHFAQLMGLFTYSYGRWSTTCKSTSDREEGISDTERGNGRQVLPGLLFCTDTLCPPAVAADRSLGSMPFSGY
jgi:hypothetical protein